MSSFGRISKGLVRERIRVITLVLGLHIFVLLGSGLWNMLDKTSEHNSISGGVFIALFIGVIFLAIMNEGTYTRDRYRLIPIADKTFYLSNMVSSLISFIYLLIGEIVIYLVAYRISPNPYDRIMINDFNSVQQYLFKFEMLVIVILAIAALFAGISLIHLLIESIGDFLPFKNQKIVDPILAFVVALVLLFPLKFITENVLRLMGVDDLSNSFTAVTHVMFATMGMMVIWIIVFGLINVYLLSRWSETTK